MTHLHWLHFSGLVHEGRCLGVSESVESSNPQFQWIDRLTTLRASVLSISATSGPHQCSRQWSPTFLRIGVTKHYLSSAIFSLWLAETGLLLLNPLAQVCTLLVPLQYNRLLHAGWCWFCMFVLYVSPSLGISCMTWSAHSAADRSKAHLTTPFINLKMNAALSRACRSCCMMLHVFQHCSTLFNSLQNPVGSGHKRLQSLQSLQSHHLGSGTSIFSLANAKTGRVRPLPDPTHPTHPTHPTDPAPTSAWRSDEDQMKIRR